jgi:hypothetical protein
MVAALAGYVRAKDGRELCISVAINNYLCTDEQARNILDTFVRAVREADFPANAPNPNPTP